MSLEWTPKSMTSAEAFLANATAKNKQAREDAIRKQEQSGGPSVPKSDNPIDRAVRKYTKAHQQIAAPLRQFQTGSAYQNKDIILARLNRIEQMIDGATISATCSGTTTIITLVWGA